MKTEKYKQLKKGSMTVEIAALMPLILLVIFGSIYLFFFVHNRAWLSAAACEAALSGSMEAVKTNGQVYETAQMRCEELQNTGFFGAENLTGEVTAGKHQVTVVYDYDTVSSYGDLNWHQHVEETSQVILPVKRIRQMKAAAELIHALEG